MFHEYPSLPGRSESEAFDEAMEHVDAETNALIGAPETLAGKLAVLRSEIGFLPPSGAE
jgi:hypothetical protein